MFLEEKKVGENHIVDHEMRKLRELLIKARALIEKKQDWSSSGWGRDGKKCAIHAIRSVATTTHLSSEAQYFLQSLIGGRHLGCFNDTHSHKEILDLFDKGIKHVS